ncbi:MAG: hypothetical protein WD793_00425 [Steroidobacteraceae bacterium]
MTTRRDFFTGAGATAGTLAALGGLSYTPLARAAALKDRQYFSHFVALELDGAYAGNLLSAEGGEPVIVPAGQPIDERRIATTNTIRYEPLRLRLGDMSAALFKWVGEASQNQITGRQAAVVTYDIDGREVYRLAMHGARPVAIATDTFDGGAREPLRFELTLAPGQSAHVLAGKYANLAVKTGLKFKGILRSNFRLYVQGYESTTMKVRNIERVGLKARPDGLLAPAPLKFAMLFRDAGPMFGWMNETLAGKSAARQAELQLLTADRTKVAASIALDQLAILRISCPAQSLGIESLQLVEVECLPAALRFNMGELLV